MKMKKTRGIIYLQLILSTFFLTVLDQWTKHLAVTHLQNQSDISLIDGVLSLHYLENRGAAFGVFQNRQGAFFILTVVILAFILYVLWRMPVTKKYLPVRILCFFLTSGALGNLIDRIRFKYVIDFIYFSLIDFPVFNVADIYVIVSMIVLLLLVLFYYKDEDDFAFLSPKKRGK